MTSGLPEAGPDFSNPPHVAMGVGLYLHRDLAKSGVQSLRILDAALTRLHLAFPADYLHPPHFHATIAA